MPVEEPKGKIRRRLSGQKDQLETAVKSARDTRAQTTTDNKDIASTMGKETCVDESASDQRFLRARSMSNDSSVERMILPEAVKQAAILIQHDEQDTASRTSGVVLAGWMILSVVVALTVHSVWLLSSKVGTNFDVATSPKEEAIKVVWCSGWITAATTGLGALPFVFVSQLSENWLAVSNAFAAGMMFAASSGLLLEGVMETADPSEIFTPTIRLGFGFWVGVLFILASKKLLDQYEDLKVMELDSLSAKRVLLIIAVMTLHSFSEGVGIGVSYDSQSLGAFISATLAVHNIPEGLAVAIVLVPRGVSVLYTALWCVATSLPQPIMAVPAYLFVEEFKFIVPIGLGFAAGAMGYVALFELFAEAKDVIGMRNSLVITTIAAIAMASVQFVLKEQSGE